MKKIVLVCVLALSLQGCTAYDVINLTTQITAFAQSAVQKGRNGIRQYCAAIGTSANEAVIRYAAQRSGACKAIARTQAIVDANRAICNNVDTLTMSQLLFYGKRLVDQWQQAHTAVVSGC